MMPLPTRYPLELSFKGSRDYLQGPDMVDATLCALGVALSGSHITDIDFSFHHIVRRKVVAVVGAPDDRVTPAAVCLFNSGTERLRAHLEETDEPVTTRTPYPENEVVGNLAIDSNRRSGLLTGRAPFSEIEIWVAMVKALHLNLFPGARGKWLFVRGLIPQYERESLANERRATLVSAMGERFTRSEIALDGRKVADIFFAQSASAP